MPTHELDTLEKRIKYLIESHALREEILDAQLVELNKVIKASFDENPELQARIAEIQALEGEKGYEA